MIHPVEAGRDNVAEGCHATGACDGSVRVVAGCQMLSDSQPNLGTGPSVQSLHQEACANT